MKKVNYLLALIVVFFSSCATYNYQTTSSDEAFAKVYCKNPEYIATITYIPFLNLQPSALTISMLTSDAQTKYGKDVTVSNIRWDIETSTAFFFFTSVQKVGATYDVIKCK
jgi:hypothetical protein